MPKGSNEVKIYTVAQNDTLSKIAKSHNISLEYLMKIQGNEHLSYHRDDIHPGDEIYLKPAGAEHPHCYHCEHHH